MALTRSQYDEIMRDYERRRITHHRELEERTKELYARYPRLEEISHLISSISVRTAKQLLLSDNPDSMSYYKEELANLRAEKSHILKMSGYPENYLEQIYDCYDCKDTGYLSNGGKCHCLKKREINVLYLQSNIQDIIKTENFDTFSYKYYSNEYIDSATGKSALVNMRNVVAICKDFIQNFSSDFSNMYIYGETGVGKTFLTNCIAKELMNKSHSVIYLSAVQLFDILAEEAFSRDNEENRTEDILTCDLLIIDDLGTELSNNFTISALFNCLNERLLRKHSTIISSNLSFVEVQDKYSDRLFSRILGNYKLLKIYGEDIRLKKRN